MTKEREKRRKKEEQQKKRGFCFPFALFVIFLCSFCGRRRSTGRILGLSIYGYQLVYSRVCIQNMDTWLYIPYIGQEWSIDAPDNITKHPASVHGSSLNHCITISSTAPASFRASLTLANHNPPKPRYPLSLSRRSWAKSSFLLDPSVRGSRTDCRTGIVQRFRGGRGEPRRESGSL